MLGLGLGLSKGTNLLSNLKLLTRNSDWAIWGDKATGMSKGTNSPQVNPIQDLVGVVGKNSFDLMTPYTILSEATFSYLPTGIRVKNTILSASYKYVTLELRGLTPNAQMTLSFVGTVAAGSSFVAVRNSSDGLINQGVSPRVFIVPVDGIVRFRFHSVTSSAVAGDVSYTNVQLELGSAPTVFNSYGKANVLLKNLLFNSSSGYTTLTVPSGKEATFIKFNGTDNYGIVANTILDVVGISDFGIGLFLKTSELTTQYFFTKAEQSEATTQYGLKLTNLGILSIILEGTEIELANGLQPDTEYAIWVDRIGGLLHCFIDGVEVFSTENTISLTSKPNFRLGALSTNAEGTTHTGFCNCYVGLMKFSKTNVQQSMVDFFKLASKYYGVGIIPNVLFSFLLDSMDNFLQDSNDLYLILE